MNFVRFDGKSVKKPLPHNMEVGQVCTRKIINRYMVTQLRGWMRAAMKQGMEFSFCEEGDTYAIRRDK